MSDTANGSGENSDSDSGGLEVKYRGDGVAVSIGDKELVFDDPERAERAALMMLRGVNGESVLLDAYTTGQERGREYGPPGENFAAAAAYWSQWVGVEMAPFDYALMMAMAKIARLQTGEKVLRRELEDIAGYIRAAAIVEGINDQRLPQQ